MERGDDDCIFPINDENLRDERGRYDCCGYCCGNKLSPGCLMDGLAMICHPNCHDCLGMFCHCLRAICWTVCAGGVT
eukprot:scaffold3526_cov153-Amphora_coffeaeformis.AAC.4